MKKILIAGAVALLALGPAAAASAAPEPKVLGACVPKHTKSGFWVMERGNLADSRYGACPSKGSGKASKVTLITLSGWMPNRIVFKRSDETETCTKVAATSSTWTFGCISVPVPSPTPTGTPTPTVSPSPTLPPASPSPTPSAT
ncbi:hypothetical protein [Acrocarpospora sp. B8E8]|uniref:hypothetical protein n=1 Tax=Acrocarpospora sp. B8E8 TaxID=3153572 RepID=UPI00325EBBB4